MNTLKVLENLQSKGIISNQQSAVIESYMAAKPFPVHWELRSVLYLGILLFGSGLGVIIYENIDTIGHQAIIALISLVTISCFFYSYKYRLPFGWQEVKNANKFSDYALLLGCTTLLILEGYLQFQYQFFGSKYGIAIFIPTVLFFFCAYRFDHKGVLSMAITGLASWLGLTIAPLSVLSKNDFTDLKLIITAIILGICLMAISWVSETRNLKKHFGFTYLFLGGNLAALANLTGLFDQDINIVFFVLGALMPAFFIVQSRQSQSLVFLLMGVIYGYIVLTYALLRVLPDSALGFLGIYYFLFSSIGVIFFLLNFKKFLGIKK